MAKQQAKRVNKEQQSVEEESAESGSMAVAANPGATGTNPEGDAEEDHVYGLASVLYHALQGVTAARKYADDARRVGAEELVEFFEECQREGTARAKQAKTLLVSYSEETDEDEDDSDEDDEDDDET
jgi:hypothetical protein